MKAHELEDAALALAVARCVGDVSVHDTDPPYYYGPPLTWERCGPLIERERINVVPQDGSDEWVAYWRVSEKHTKGRSGPTPLIAAMRAYVAMKASTRKLEGVG